MRLTRDSTPVLTRLPFLPASWAPNRIPAESGELRPARACYRSLRGNPTRMGFASAGLLDRARAGPGDGYRLNPRNC
jgi:hypothetical protein